MKTKRVISVFILTALLITGVFVVQAASETSKLTKRDNRAEQADVLRWEAMGDYYSRQSGSSSISSADEIRSREVAAKRWQAMADAYSKADLQEQNNLASAARYTGLALDEYERTGNVKLLPKCISAVVYSLLPSHIGSNSWKGIVPACPVK